MKDGRDNSFTVRETEGNEALGFLESTVLLPEDSGVFAKKFVNRSANP